MFENLKNEKFQFETLDNAQQSLIRGGGQESTGAYNQNGVKSDWDIRVSECTGNNYDYYYSVGNGKVQGSGVSSSVPLAVK